MMLYIDCIGGVAGDMLLASLVDAGASCRAINAELQNLGVPGLTVSTERASRHAINCCHVTVTWDKASTQDPADHADRAGHTDHEGRPYLQVRELITQARFSPRVEMRALAAFRLLAEAEGRIHGIEPDVVHFHEVGSEDSIADIVGVAIALELLGIDEVQCSPLPIGRGIVRSAHGVLPLPAPATLELLRGIPTIGIDIDKETVTPTGAALVVSLASTFGGFPSLTTSAIGYGAGGRDLPQRPNIVRAVIGVLSPTMPEDAGPKTNEVLLIETNLDDCLPELIPDAATAAMRAGALDVWTTPVVMKKGRPGFILHALSRRSNAHAVAESMLKETSALGVRMCTYERLELDRSFVIVEVDSEPISVKLGMRNGRIINFAPEHDDCALAAAKLGVSVKEVYVRALTMAFAVHGDASLEKVI